MKLKVDVNLEVDANFHLLDAGVRIMNGMWTHAQFSGTWRAVSRRLGSGLLGVICGLKICLSAFIWGALVHRGGGSCATDTERKHTLRRWWRSWTDGFATPYHRGSCDSSDDATGSAPTGPSRYAQRRLLESLKLHGSIKSLTYQMNYLVTKT